MRINISDNRILDIDSGVSETIGAILLVSLVVICVSLVGIFLFSQQPPSKIPNLNFMVGTDRSQTTLYLYHNGGDPLNVGEFSVLVDGIPKTYIVSGGGQWSLGKNLIVPISQAPNNVQIVYNGTSSGGGGADVLLRSGSANIVNKVNISPDQIPYLDCSAVRNWACADQIPREIIEAEYSGTVSESAINFLRSSSTGLDTAGKSLKFKVMDNNATFTIELPGGPLLYNMSKEETLQITLRSNSKSLRAFTLGTRLWEINADGVDLTYTFVNTSSVTWSNVKLIHVNAPVFEDIGSSMAILGASSAYTFLSVNKTIYKNGIDSHNIVISGIRPVGLGLFVLEYNDSDHSVYFVGNADSITINGVVQNYP